MKIKVTTRKWATATQKRSLQKLANHVCSHYPKDKALHKAVRDTFKSMDAAASNWSKGWKKASAKKRGPARKSAPKRRTASRRRTSSSRWSKRGSRRAAPKRRTVRRRTTSGRRWSGRRKRA